MAKYHKLGERKLRELKETEAEEVLEHATGKEEREHYGKEKDFFQEAIDKIMGKHKRK